MSQLLLKNGQVINSNHVADITHCDTQPEVVNEAMRMAALGYPENRNMLLVIVGAWDLDNPANTAQLHAFTNINIESPEETAAIRDSFGEIKTDGMMMAASNGWHVSAQPFLVSKDKGLTISTSESVMEEEKGMAQALLTVYRIEVLKEKPDLSALG